MICFISASAFSMSGIGLTFLGLPGTLFARRSALGRQMDRPTSGTKALDRVVNLRDRLGNELRLF
jgi:hypothetical protein